MKMIETLKLGVKLFDLLIPEGIPRNTLIIIRGEPGTGKVSLLTEIAYRTLKLSEPVIMVVYGQTPLSLFQRFLSHGWNISDALKGGKIVFLDGFSTRFRKQETRVQYPIVKETYEQLKRAHKLIDNPQDIHEIFSEIIENATQLKMLSRGVILIDSLIEMLTLIPKEQVLEFIRRLRVYIAKDLWVPIFFGASVGLMEDFYLLLDYMVDGAIDIRFHPKLLDKGILVREIRVRKLPAKTVPLWVPFKIEKGKGATPLVSKEKIEEKLAEYMEKVARLEEFEKEEKIKPSDYEI